MTSARRPPKAALIGITAIAALAAFAVPSAIADTMIYDNIPTPAPGNLPSEAFEAQSASEFGGQAQFDGTQRQRVHTRVLMSSWGCESGGATTGDCYTTPGLTFSEPITLNVYAVNPDDSPGALIATTTRTF